MKRNRLKIVFYFCALWLWLPSLCFVAEGRDFVVVIDAGHGGNDPGAIGQRGKEKNINLEVALKVGNLIKNNCPATKVVYTRSTDIFVPLDRRAQIANNAKADLFISIQTNSVAKGRSVKGAETYTLGLHRTEENLEVAKKENSVILIEDNYQQRYAGFNPNSAESYIIFEFLQDKNMENSVKLATYIQKHFKSTGGRIDKGVHQAGFLVLRETSMPSVLIELGYISNPEEENFLLSSAGTTRLSNSIYNAFINYKRDYEIKAGAANTRNNYVEVVASDIKEEPTDTTQEKADNSIVQTKDSVEPTPTYPPTVKPTRNRKTNTTPTESQSNNAPIFKIQILTSDRKLPTNSSKFKGLSPVSYFIENGIYKYTYQESKDYNSVLKVKRSINSKFKDAFIIAFKGDEKVNINEAINEFKKGK